MSNQASSHSSYDDVPYESWPYAQTHPDRLASIATLLGLKPQRIDQARVLELGCASGGNIIPMAETYPDSRFWGIDLSARQLSGGLDTISDLGLRNIQLRHCSIMDVDPDLGQFHYIIVHGVYSWVSDQVQQRILHICRHHLAENGIAYVSYNTYPGWRMRGMIRDMLVYHAGQFPQPEEQIGQARALLAFLADWVPTEDNPYGTYLRQELELFGRVRDAYLYHDHLEGINEPVYFHEFARRAAQHQLQYLGEAELSVMATSNFPDELETTLQRISRDTIQIEQYMDFLRNRTFRQTLLCGSEHRVDRSLDPRYAEELYFASPLRPDDEHADELSSDSVRFSHGSVHVDTADPLIKAALTILAGQWPRWVSFRWLLDESRRQASNLYDRDCANGDDDGRHLAEHLIRCLASAVVEAHAGQPQFVHQISDRPAATALARRQAQSTNQVTNRRHEIVNLDQVGRRTLACLDGQHDRAAIQNRLLELVDQEQLTVQIDDQPVRDPQQLATALEKVVETTVTQLRDAAMLVG